MPLYHVALAQEDTRLKTEGLTVANAFNLSIRGRQSQLDCCEFDASLVYKSELELLHTETCLEKPRKQKPEKQNKTEGLF